MDMEHKIMEHHVAERLQAQMQRMVMDLEQLRGLTRKLCQVLWTPKLL